MPPGTYIKSWDFTVQNKPFTIRAEHCFWNGAKSYYVNDTQVYQVRGSLSESAKFSFDYSYTDPLFKSLIKYKAVGLIRDFTLSVNGKTIKGTEIHTPLPKWVGFVYGIIIGIACISYLKFFK